MLAFFIKHSRIYILALMCGWSLSANAHLMAAQKGTLNIIGDLVYMVMSVPVSAFSTLDQDRDGHITPEEMMEHRIEIEKSIRSGFHLGAQNEGQFLDIMLDLSQNVGTPLADQIVVMGVLQYKAIPNKFTFSVTLFGTSDDEQSYQISASHTEVDGSRNSATAILTSRLNNTVFFGSSWDSLKNFMQLGLSHILTGFDHILFLITLLVVGISARRWLTLLSIFTIAHGCTFALASLGWFSLPAALIEPLIAASIVLIALAQIFGLKLKLTTEMIVVFTCGLIHGLGFALAVGNRTIDATYPTLSIVGFNLGVELGQLSIAILVLIAVMLWRKLMIFKYQEIVVRATTYSILFVSIVWFTQRVLINFPTVS